MRQLKHQSWRQQVRILSSETMRLIDDLERARLALELGELAGVLAALSVAANEAEWQAVLAKESDDF